MNIRSLRPVLVAVAIASALCAAAVALLEVGLPAATASDRIAADVLRVLQSTHSAGATITLGDRSIVAACRRDGRRRVVSLSDGSILVLNGSHVTRLREPKTARPVSAEPDLVAAEADLSGDHGLYARELVGALAARGLTVRETQYRGAAVYVLRLGARRPAVDLVVDRRTLRPVAARYESSSLSGTASFRTATGPAGVGC